jgi:uncharacterized protein (TIGR02453 family)
MKYLNKEYFKFFDGLTKNNNKDWFEKNRATYENEVKKPFRELTQALTDKLAKDVPELNRDITKAIFRINRDIRFAKDKSPYKVHMAAVFSRTGTKDQEFPGFYIHIGADDIMVGGGKYFTTKEDLSKIRQEIYYNNTAFKKLLNDKAFKEKFKTLDGEKSKVLDPDYKAFLTEQPLIANKQFWYWARFTREQATGDKFDTLVLSYFKAGMKMNNFLWQAINA